MGLTLEQKKQLTDQIANNLTGDLIKVQTTDFLDRDRDGIIRFGAINYNGKTFPILVATQNVKIIFNINNQEIFTINECNCAECGRYKSIEEKPNHHRKLIETNIVANIIKEISNTAEQINLVCVGSDWAGLTVILAKLYKLGYTNFSIINIEQNQDKYNRNMTQLEQSNNHACLQFWKELFSKATIQCITIGIDLENVNLTQYADYFITSTKLIVFAEDLGNPENTTLDIDDMARTHNINVNKIVDTIKKIKTKHISTCDNKIFVVTFDGAIIENIIAPHILSLYSFKPLSQLNSPTTQKSTKETVAKRQSFLGLKRGFLL